MALELEACVLSCADLHLQPRIFFTQDLQFHIGSATCTGGTLLEVDLRV